MSMNSERFGRGNRQGSQVRGLLYPAFNQSDLAKRKKTRNEISLPGGSSERTSRAVTKRPLARLHLGYSVRGESYCIVGGTEGKKNRTLLQGGLFGQGT